MTVDETVEAITTSPKHIAIVMDGNGRWAKQRHLPRVAGHLQGVKRARQIVEVATSYNVKFLTLFAFGRENWRRPVTEVSFLMKMLYQQLKRWLVKLHDKNVKVRFIGDRTRLDAKIIAKINDLEQLTAANTGLNLIIALDYSGTYDILQAVQKIVAAKIDQTKITEELFRQYLLSHPLPYPDLLIRTSGEIRLSNFMLWQLAYTECYFTDILWPDFDKNAFLTAIKWFNNRQRRFGMIEEQIEENLLQQLHQNAYN